MSCSCYKKKVSHIKQKFQQSSVADTNVTNNNVHSAKITLNSTVNVATLSADPLSETLSDPLKDTVISPTIGITHLRFATSGLCPILTLTLGDSTNGFQKQIIVDGSAFNLIRIKTNRGSFMLLSTSIDLVYLLDDPSSSDGRWYVKDNTTPINWFVTDRQGDILTGFNLGESCALSENGSTLAVGAPIDNGIGSVLIYVRTRLNNIDQWIEHTKLTGEKLNDWFGTSVALTADGKTLAVLSFLQFATPRISRVQIYNLDTTNKWVQVKQFDITGTSDGNNYTNSARSLAFGNDGKRLIVSSDFAQRTNIYDFVANNWVLSGFIDKYYGSVSITKDGIRLTIGVVKNNLIELPNSGVYVYEYNPTVPNKYEFVQHIVPLSFDHGLYFQATLNKADGNILVVGCPLVNTVLIYRRDTTTKLFTLMPDQSIIDNTDTTSNFGYSIALSSSGNTLAIGAPIYNRGEGKVAIYVYGKLFASATEKWSKYGYDLLPPRCFAIEDPNIGGGGSFGTSLALDWNGDTLAVGAPSSDSGVQVFV